MKEMMFEFLNNFYPDVFLLRTKFGIIPRYNIKGNYAIGEVKRKHIKMLCNFFSSDLDYCTDVYEEWLNNKLVYVRLKNSTNEDTFVVESDLMITPTSLS
jgi:hypothetical protein